MSTPDAKTVREVTQWFLAGRDDGIPGDCVRASVASLLDLDPHNVPHFTCQDDTRVWPLAIAGFAAEHGWRISRRAYDGGELPKFGLAIGPSPRGVSHMVVVRDGEMVWDPHPSREGLVDVQQVVEFTRAVEWPDEQQPADVVTAEQQQDGAAEAPCVCGDPNCMPYWRPVHQQMNEMRLRSDRVAADFTEAMLEEICEERIRAEQAEAERAALAARVAELTAERDEDARAVAAWLAADDEGMSPDYWVVTRTVVRARFADRIEALAAAETEES